MPLVGARRRGDEDRRGLGGVGRRRDASSDAPVSAPARSPPAGGRGRAGPRLRRTPERLLWQRAPPRAAAPPTACPAGVPCGGASGRRCAPRARRRRCPASAPPGRATEAIDPVELWMMPGRSMPSTTNSASATRSSRATTASRSMASGRATALTSRSIGRRSSCRLSHPVQDRVQVDGRRDRVDVQPGGDLVDVHPVQDRVQVDGAATAFDVEPGGDLVDVHPVQDRVQVEARRHGVDVDVGDQRVEVDMVADQVGEVHEIECAVQHDGGDALGQRLRPARRIRPLLPPAFGEAAQEAGRRRGHHGGRREHRRERAEDESHPLGDARDASTATAPSPSTTSPARGAARRRGPLAGFGELWSIRAPDSFISRARADPAPVSSVVHARHLRVASHQHGRAGDATSDSSSGRDPGPDSTPQYGVATRRGDCVLPPREPDNPQHRAGPADREAAEVTDRRRF